MTNHLKFKYLNKIILKKQKKAVRLLSRTDQTECQGNAFRLPRKYAGLHHLHFIKKKQNLNFSLKIEFHLEPYSNRNRLCRRCIMEQQTIMSTMTLQKTPKCPFKQAIKVVRRPHLLMRCLEFICLLHRTGPTIF